MNLTREVDFLLITNSSTNPHQFSFNKNIEEFYHLWHNFSKSFYD